GHALAWVQPYKNKAASYFGGVFSVPDLGQPSAIPSNLQPELHWYKAADAKELSYDAGFPAPLEVTATATAFDAVKTSADLESLLGLTASMLNVEIEGAGLSNAPESAIVLPAAFTL